MVTQREVDEAVDLGCAQYWDDAARQAVAFDAWARGGFQGAGPQHERGSINTYVKRAVCAALGIQRRDP